MPQIDSLLSARLFLSPQVVGERIYFLSNLSGRISLYVMDHGGSVPEPLLPPQIAVQNPGIMDGYVYCVFPALGKIVVMLDHDGDENYQPMLIPIDGGIPEPAFGDYFASYRVHLLHCDTERNIIYLNVESRREALFQAYQARLESATLKLLGESRWGAFVDAVAADHSAAVLIDTYTMGDHALYLWREENEGRQALYGTPLEERRDGDQAPLNSINAGYFTPGNRGILCITSLFSDTYGLGYIPMATPRDIHEVAVSGTVHTGMGELVSLEHLRENRYLVGYNIDGCSWLYEGGFDETARHMALGAVICGTGQLSNGVLEGVYYDRAGDRYSLSFSTATAPTDIYTVEGRDRAGIVQHTHERILGIALERLAPGEDASFTSFDGQRISARLYLPAETLGYQGPRPLVYYIHGGPQGQERPNFAWFSMPLIQFLTLSGCAVFVPNARGSTGYGLSYTKKVDHDWGGDDRLDHVHAMQVLARDERVDTQRAGVVGRSYGGYMTLTLATRHPELWSAAVDMFGPYDLSRFMEYVPETWKAYFSIAVGDPVKDRDFLLERSPSTYIDRITCPLLVIQGQNDPRVVERESRLIVERLRAGGQRVEYLVFENEGHDILKFENRVRCYNAIAAFFAQYLEP